MEDAPAKNAIAEWPTLVRPAPTLRERWRRWSMARPLLTGVVLGSVVAFPLVFVLQDWLVVPLALGGAVATSHWLAWREGGRRRMSEAERPGWEAL